MILSVDLETTGLDPVKNVPISIGACTLDQKHRFYRTIYWDAMWCATAAYKVNRLPFELNEQNHWLHIQCEFGKWLVGLGHTPGSELKILGFNPAFDRSFLENVWQGTFPFHYRCVDLNSIITFQGTDRKELLDQAAHIATTISAVGGAHHAGWDALFNTVVWGLLGGKQNG